jgi:transposase
MATIYAGIDVGKAKLNMSLLECRSVWNNTQAGVKRLLTRVKGMPELPQVVCEATGGIERLLVDQCFAQNIPVSVVPPKRVRDFAKSEGLYAKADHIDDGVIERFSLSTHPHPDQPVPETTRRLQELHGRRRQVMELMAIQQQHLEGLTLPKLRQGCQKTLKSLARELATVDRLIAEILHDDAKLQAKVACMTVHKGVGTQTALALLTAMPELGTLNRKEVAALAGLAPFCKDSGQKQGKRFIQGGRKVVRTILYMACLSAITYNPVIKEFYDRLVARGKVKMVALTAAMRRFLTILNAAMKNHLATLET